MYLFYNYYWVVILTLVFFVKNVTLAQTKDPLKERFEQIAKLKANVEANPKSLESHHLFIHAFNINDSTLEKQYKTWVKLFPKLYNVPFVIGEAYTQAENPKATPFLIQASILKPEEAKIWYLLSIDALYTNDIIHRQEYLKKAIHYAPANPDYAFYYADCYKNTDIIKHDSLLLEVVRRFPDSERCSQALYWLAHNSTVSAEKIAYYKELYNRKSNQLFDWYIYGMSEYFDLLIKTNIEQAFELGVKLLLEGKRNRNLWNDRIKIVDAFLKARELMEKKNPKQALLLLNKIDLGSLDHGNYVNAGEQLELFKAEAADENENSNDAYNQLLKYYSTTPTANIQTALYKYGRKLSLDSSMVMKSIYKLRDKNAIQASDFSLVNYMSNQKASLISYFGKVILLTYWFPGCGPCRLEFPYFELVLKKFNRAEIAYMGLNLEPSQDNFVLPFLKETGYTFIPLHDSKMREKGNLKADEAPTNYLIDQKGRIVFSNFRIDASNEETLELMIKETLAAKDY